MENNMNTNMNTTSLNESKQIELTNLKKRSKILRIVAKIFEVCNYVGAGLCALAAVIMAVAPQHWNIIMSDNQLESFFTSEEKQEFLQRKNYTYENQLKHLIHFWHFLLIKPYMISIKAKDLHLKKK